MNLLYILSGLPVFGGLVQLADRQKSETRFPIIGLTFGTVMGIDLVNKRYGHV